MSDAVSELMEIVRQLVQACEPNAQIEPFEAHWKVKRDTVDPVGYIVIRDPYFLRWYSYLDRYGNCHVEVDLGANSEKERRGQFYIIKLACAFHGEGGNPRWWHYHLLESSSDSPDLDRLLQKVDAEEAVLDSGEWTELLEELVRAFATSTR